MNQRLVKLVLAMSVVAAAGSARAWSDTVSYTATVMTPSPADVVNITYDLGAGAQTAAVYAGEINWTVTESTDPSMVVGSSFGSFCVDLADDISVGNSYQYATTANLSSLGGLSNLSPSQADTVIGELGTLFADDFSTVVTPGNNDASAAFQMAIWKLIYGDAAVGFTAGSDPSLTTATLQDLSDAHGASKPFLLTGLASVDNQPAAQDQIMPSLTVPTSVAAVPLPKASSQTALLGGVATLAWAVTRSRRSVIAAAVRA